MSDDEVAAFLDEQRMLNVATIGPTGHPHLVAMWYAVLDGRPAFWTFAKSQKVVNLRRDPQITGLVESRRHLPRAARRRAGRHGPARRGLRPRSWTSAGGWPRSTTARRRRATRRSPFLEAQAHKRIGVVIDVERTVSWDHRKLPGGY